jgi:membrane protein DedA with SNARE-associated domain
MLENILQYFHAYGYWILFFGVMLENAGVPLPGETLLLAAGVYSQSGHFHFWAVLLVAFFGAVLGDNGGYWLGRTLGRRFLAKHGAKILFNQERQKLMQSYFKTYGPRTVLVARFITGLRVFTALFAGASEMEWNLFFRFNAMGAALWTAVIGSLGYFFGKNWDTLERVVGWTGVLLLIVAVLMGLSFGMKKIFSPD